MGSPFTSTAISGYNTNPPPSDGTTTEANRVEWDTIKTKLPDPIKTAFEASEAVTLAAFGRVVGGNGVSATAISYQVLSTDQGKIISATASGITITSPDATDVDDPFVFGIHNTSGGDITFDGSGSQTVDGAANITLAAGEGVLVFTDGSNWLTLGRGSAVRATNTGFALINGTLTAAVGSSALTIAIKASDGTDPTASNPVYVIIRNATAATGTYTLMAITAATSLVISSGSTLGTSSSVAFRIWIVGFNDAGTFRLGAINCRNGLNIYPLTVNTIASSTAEGGAGGADSASTFYTGTAVASKPYQVLGYMTWESGLSPAGTWGLVPTRIQLFGEGVPLPGAVVQIGTTSSGAAAATTTTVPLDDSIPQITEGAEFMSLALQPFSAANLLHVSHIGSYSCNPAGTAGVALFQDSTANALAALAVSLDSNSNMAPVALNWSLVAGTTGAITLRIRAGSSAGATLTFNGFNSARIFGGVMGSTLTVTEIMA